MHKSVSQYVTNEKIQGHVYIPHKIGVALLVYLGLFEDDYIGFSHVGRLVGGVWELVCMLKLC